MQSWWEDKFKKNLTDPKLLNISINVFGVQMSGIEKPYNLDRPK